ncbi:hypothetical protein [Micromonospora sp. NPDC002575]|uniref:hypothetical protein n=1 Tax=Micromonospora sp. NPDC002575 TaxID=3364222 RepID=UPI0036916EE6
MNAPTRAAALSGAVALALALTPGAAGAAGGGPGVTPPAGPLRVGQRVLVGLDGWPAGTVQVEVCGNAARRGALDCATGDAVHAQVPPSGRARLPVLLAAPPVACPCVLRVRTPTGTAAATADLPLAGVGAPPAAPGVPAGLTLEALRADDRSGPRGWFGLPGELAVQFSLRNPGTEDVTDPPFTLLVGPPGRARTIVAAPAIGTVAAGTTRDYRITVPTGAAPYGRYEIDGRIETPGRPVAFTVDAARRPWGLPVAAAVLTAALLLARPGRRRHAGGGQGVRRDPAGVAAGGGAADAHHVPVDGRSRRALRSE